MLCFENLGYLYEIVLIPTYELGFSSFETDGKQIQKVQLPLKLPEVVHEISSRVILLY